MKMKRTIFLFLLFLSLCSCSIEFEHSQSKAAIQVSAEDLWSEFKHNRDSALYAYDGREIVVSGEIAESPGIFMQQPCIILENGEDCIPDGIFCMFPEGYDVESYNVGETISVQGRCSLAMHLAGDDTNPFIFIYDSCVLSP